MGNFKINRRIFIVIAMLTLMLSGIASITSSYKSVDAGAGCPEVGSFMKMKNVNKNANASPDSSNRKWTVEEVFKDSIAHSSFYGEGPETWLFAEKEGRGAAKTDFGWTDDTQKTFDSSRGFSCGFGGFDGINHPFTMIANGLTGFTGAVIMSLIGKDMMAETLTTVIGGTGGSDGGLIGTFLSSFYLPLVILAVIIMVVTLIYKGLVQQKMREALGSMIWTFGAFIIGVTLMIQPQLLANIPQKATSTITTCVLGALSGQNCLSGSVEAPSMLAGKECLSSTGGSNADSAENVVNSMNCTIWKTFVLEPWAEEQFGAPYDELYTKNAPEGEDVWENLPEGQADKYCVNLSSNKSHDDSIAADGGPVMDGGDGTVCNVALYHLFVKTRMTDTTNQLGNNYNDENVILSDDTGEYDSRWYDIAVPMAGDTSKWANWSGDGRFFSRMLSNTVGLIAVIASSTILLTLGVFGGAYKITGLILMAFAPVFFLFAIEPTRGKRIFLGWLETLVSSILKYFAITVLIVVALVMYAGLLSNTSGVTSLVGVIIMTLALHMYRKEIVDLIGASNMGGQRLSNKVNEVGSKAGKFTKEKGGAVVGGLVGGGLGTSKARKERVKARNKTIEDLQSKISSASTPEEEKFWKKEKEEEEKAKKSEGTRIGTFASGSLKGTGSSFKRSMKRGTGLAANAFKESDRTKEAIMREDDQDIKSNKARRNKFEEDLSSERASDPTKSEIVDIEKSKSEIKRDVAVSGIVDTQRENVDYEGSLNKQETKALDDFADKIIKNASDEELIETANNTEVQNDPNKRSIVSNEINARLSANSMIGVASHALSRSDLVNNKVVSDEELLFNLEMHRENYLETGDESELDKYLSAGSEHEERNPGTFDRDNAEQVLREFKSDIGDNHKRKGNIPREEDLKGKDNYKIDIDGLKQGNDLDTSKVTVPKKLANESLDHKDKIDEVHELNKDVVNEKAKKEEEAKKEKEVERKDNPLPKIEDIDESEPKEEVAKVEQEETVEKVTRERDNEDPKERNTGGPQERDTGGPQERNTGGPQERNTGGPQERDTGGPQERDEKHERPDEKVVKNDVPDERTPKPPPKEQTIDVTKRHRPEPDGRFDPKDKNDVDPYDNMIDEFNDELDEAIDELNDDHILDDILNDDEDNK